MVGHHRHDRGTHVEADQLIARLVAGKRPTVQHQLRRIHPTAPDPDAHDAAEPQPAVGHVCGRPPVEWAAWVNREPKHEPRAPLQAAAVGRYTQRAAKVLGGQAMEPAAPALEPGPTSLTEHPAVHGLVDPCPQYLRLLSHDLLA
jgi:hypothetical protein